MFRLAAGRYQECPFTPQVPPHQPFFLAAIEVKTKKYDESAYTPVAANYRSAKEIRIEVACGQLGCDTKSPSDLARVMDACQSSDCGPWVPLLPSRRQQRHCVGEPCRLVIRLMLDSFSFQLLYADDLKFLVSGPNKYTDFWTMLVAWLMCGAPMSWKKFRGGLELDFVGFFTDYGRFELGLSEKRATWVMQVLRGLVENKYVITGYAFGELVGRLGFASQAVPWIRPLLAPLYAWGSKFKGGTVSRVPELVGYTLQLIQQRFEKGLFRVCCDSPQVGREEVFRTDAKCAEGLVAVGGWATQDGSAKQARWFALQLTPEQAPWLFERSLSAQRMSTTAEIFAIYVGLHVFGYLKKGGGQLQKPGAALIASGTDNLAAEHLSRRRLSTKMPLGLLLAQMNTNLWDAGLWLEARWRPRGENVEADDLTNSKFEKFDLKNRVGVKLEDIDMEIFNGLRATYGIHEQAPKFIGQVGDETRKMGRKRPPKSSW
ncbi:unnamed protein product [Symbiodinium natans]|uniref:Reverse transcriptase domain-containing protein n=1 Tax=Symbiodinium natans TaxID=878477 RepID=A0A812SVW5_9DINO|nr:unnamed protein product [Symbiodinium natans]